MPAANLLFVQGGGDMWAPDGSGHLAKYIATTLGDDVAVKAPEMPDASSDPRYLLWRDQIEGELGAMDGPVIVVGHSVGGSSYSGTSPRVRRRRPSSGCSSCRCRGGDPMAGTGRSSPSRRTSGQSSPIAQSSSTRASTIQRFPFRISGSTNDGCRALRLEPSPATSIRLFPACRCWPMTSARSHQGARSPEGQRFGTDSPVVAVRQRAGRCKSKLRAWITALDPAKWCGNPTQPISRLQQLANVGQTEIWQGTPRCASSPR